MRDDINVNSTLSLQISSSYVEIVERENRQIKSGDRKGKISYFFVPNIYNGYAYKEEFVLRDIFRKLLLDLWELVSSFDKENFNVSHGKGMWNFFLKLLKFSIKKLFKKIFFDKKPSLAI